MLYNLLLHRHEKLPSIAKTLTENLSTDNIAQLTRHLKLFMKKVAVNGEVLIVDFRIKKRLCDNNLVFQIMREHKGKWIFMYGGKEEVEFYFPEIEKPLPVNQQG